MNVEYQLCVASPESRSKLTLLICQSVTYRAKMVACPALLRILDNCFHWLSPNSVSQMCESSDGCPAFHKKVFYSVSRDLSDHKPFLLKPLYSEELGGKLYQDWTCFKVLGSQFWHFYFVCSFFFLLSVSLHRLQPNIFEGPILFSFSLEFVYMLYCKRNTWFFFYCPLLQHLYSAFVCKLCFSACVLKVPLPECPECPDWSGFTCLAKHHPSFFHNSSVDVFATIAMLGVWLRVVTV